MVGFLDPLPRSSLIELGLEPSHIEVFSYISENNISFFQCNGVMILQHANIVDWRLKKFVLGTLDVTHQILLNYFDV
jgi:hypothetical protein